MSPPLVVFGAGGHAKVVADIARCRGQTVLGFVDPAAEATSYLGAKLAREWGTLAAPRATEIVIAIGDNARRKSVADEILTFVSSPSFATLTHPSAMIAPDVVLGPGSVVMAAAVINSGAILGSHGIVNTGALLDHDVRTGDFVSIAPGVTIGGHVSIDRFSAVGIGAVVVHNIRIGENSVVGAGALVLDDIGCDIVAYGTPCRPVRVRRFGDPYL